MSVYKINKLFYLMDNDPHFRRKMTEDPATTLGSLHLTGEETEAITTGDVGRLYRMGVHTFCLNHMARYEMFGVNRQNYLDRIRDGMAYDPRFELGSMPLQYVPKLK